MDIIDAINNRNTITFTYDGHSRVVIPAAYGNHISTGNKVLRGYQIGGTSSTRSVPLWDMFLVDKITNLHVNMDDTFEDNPHGYVADDSHIDPIEAQL